MKKSRCVVWEPSPGVPGRVFKLNFPSQSVLSVFLCEFAYAQTRSMIRMRIMRASAPTHFLDFDSANFKILNLQLTFGELLDRALQHLQGKPHLQVFPEPLSSASKEKEFRSLRMSAVPRTLCAPLSSLRERKLAQEVAVRELQAVLGTCHLCKGGRNFYVTQPSADPLCGLQGSRSK